MLRRKAECLDELAALLTRFLPPELFASGSGCSRQARCALLQTIAADPVPLRPNRVEPRARKRRPKPYQWLTRPRRRMRVSASRRQK